ncbi:MAG: hypothetical protein COB12_12040 [Flavobacterium sp.]|nr:MAG: hypothetical protein COB12_12040 [Flavobacterium sp.]
MNIYKIKMETVAPKDSWKSVDCFLLAKDEEAVYKWLDKNKCYDAWNDKEEDGHTYEIQDEDYNVIGHENFKEKMLRLKGEINDEDRNCEDAYYGVEFYGWELIEFPDTLNAVKMLEFTGMLKRAKD